MTPKDIQHCDDRQQDGEIGQEQRVQYRYEYLGGQIHKLRVAKDQLEYRDRQEGQAAQMCQGRTPPQPEGQQAGPEGCPDQG